jgi:hypothetical protein
MVLSAQEESLISVVRALPPAEAGKVLDWARQLADLAGGRAIEWSDVWTDEDLVEATAAAVQRFEDYEREDR